MFKHAFITLLVCTLVILTFTSIGYNKHWDISQNKINTLSSASKELLNNLDAQLKIDVYSPNIDVLNTCNEILSRYSQWTDNIKISYHETILDPVLSGKLKVLTDHSLVVTYKDNSKAIDLKVHNLSEEVISNLIQQTLKNNDQWVVFLNGHNESDPFDETELGISNFSKLLKDQGLHIAQLNLAKEQTIPDNTNLLIVANPQTDLLPVEKTLIHDYLASGKHLLWLTEPDSPATDFLRTEFDLRLTPGVAVDPNSIALGSPHPALKIVTQYPEHAINRGFTTSIILPWSGNLIRTGTTSNWKEIPILTTNDQTWTYNGPPTLEPNILALHKDRQGPLTIGMALTKEIPHKAEQRVVVIADSSFILNKYIALFTNSKLTSNIVNWLQTNTAAFVISPHSGKDFSYTPNKASRFLHNIFFPFIFPLTIVAMGFYLQRR